MPPSQQSQQQASSSLCLTTKVNSPLQSGRLPKLQKYEINHHVYAWIAVGEVQKY